MAIIGIDTYQAYFTQAFPSIERRRLSEIDSSVFSTEIHPLSRKYGMSDDRHQIIHQVRRQRVHCMF